MCLALYVAISHLFNLHLQEFRLIEVQNRAGYPSSVSYFKTLKITMFSSRFNLKLPLYYIASITVSIGGVLFGLDTGTIGPVTAMSTFTATFGQLSPMKHGSIVSAILLPAAFAGLFAGNIADSYGRATTLIVGGTIFGFGATLAATGP